MSRTAEEAQACHALLMMGGKDNDPALTELNTYVEHDEEDATTEDHQNHLSENESSKEEFMPSGSPHQRGGKRKRVSNEEIRACFNMPLTRAAEELGTAHRILSYYVLVLGFCSYFPLP